MTLDRRTRSQLVRMSARLEAIAGELTELRDQLRAVLDADRPPSTEPQVYGLHSAAEVLGVSPNTVRRLIVQRKLTGTTVDGATQIDAADIARYLAASRRQDGPRRKT